MSETKHTPLPWKHDEHFPTALWASDIWIGSMSVEAIFLEEATGNAKLAVEAVNNYDSLRSTVRTLAEALREIHALQPRMVEVLRSNGYKFERFPRDMKANPPTTDGERWEALAFSMYCDLVEAHTTSDSALSDPVVQQMLGEK